MPTPIVPTLPTAKPGTPLARVNTVIEDTIDEHAPGMPITEGCVGILASQPRYLTTHLTSVAYHLATLTDATAAAYYRPATARAARQVAYAAAHWWARCTGEYPADILASQARTAARQVAYYRGREDVRGAVKTLASQMWTDLATAVHLDSMWPSTDLTEGLKGVITRALAAATLTEETA